jgi:arylsulfatase A-like enzyme
MTDDQGYANLSCTGHPVLKTPAADQLYKKSVRLTDYHVDPTCAPTRSALMTGHYSHRAGVWHTIMGRELLRPDEITMAEVFKKSGYRTGFFGKWHLGDNYPQAPRFKGFDKTVKLGGGGISQGPDFWGNDYFDDVYFVNGKPVQFKGFCTDVFFDEAMKFIDKNRNEPFFVYLATNAPHSPMYAPDKFSKRFKGMTYKNYEIDDATANYYGMIENIDYNLNKMIEFLKKENLYDNTVLIFTTDNGPVTKVGQKIYNAMLKGGKGSYYDGGHRVFFFISYPDGGWKEGVDVKRTTAHIDILPTLIELCSLKKPDVKFDGRSILPLIKNPDAEWRERDLVVESQRVHMPVKYRKFSVMNTKWRLAGNQKKKFELFDALNDRKEENDLFARKKEVAAGMLESYEKFWDDVSSENSKLSRIVIGSPEENPTRLMSHDWFGVKGAWSQRLVRKGGTRKEPTGIWKVKVDSDGEYQFSLRRWPAEADKGINDPYIGKGINASKAVLEIEGKHLEKDIPPGAVEVTFDVTLKKGDADVNAYFEGIKGNKHGAYYVYIMKMDKKTPAGWQTRESLGLPLAVYPEHPGKDPYSSE